MTLSNSIKEYNGFYRGIVVDNYDPETKGRVKLYVPGIYPKELAKNSDNLPWAEPAMPMFGGGWVNENYNSGKPLDGDLNMETGHCSPPHTSSTELDGAQVWVFFERGDPQFPIFTFAIQSGDGWLAEHDNQHVMKTDNVRVRIDEKMSKEELAEDEMDANRVTSTCYFDSYNKNCNEISKTLARKKMHTRVDIEIWNLNASAVHLHIKGDVNMHVEGDIFEEHFGDRHTTHIGNHYRYHKGETLNVIDGDKMEVRTGDYTLEQTGDNEKVYTGNLYNIQNGIVEKLITDCEHKTIMKSAFWNIHDEDSDGKALVINADNIDITSYNDTTIFSNKTFNSLSKADTNIQAGMKGILEGKFPNYIFELTNGIHQNSCINMTSTLDTNIMIGRDFNTHTRKDTNIIVDKIFNTSSGLSTNMLIGTEFNTNSGANTNMLIGAVLNTTSASPTNIKGSVINLN